MKKFVKTWWWVIAMVLLLVYLVTAFIFGWQPYKAIGFCGVKEPICQNEEVQDSTNVDEIGEVEVSPTEPGIPTPEDPTPGNDGCQIGFDPLTVAGQPVFDENNVVVCQQRKPEAAGPYGITSVEVISSSNVDTAETATSAQLVVFADDPGHEEVSVTVSCQGECPAEVTLQWIKRHNVADSLGVDVPRGYEGLNEFASELAEAGAWLSPNDITATVGVAREVTGLEPGTLYLVRATAKEGTSQIVEIETTKPMAVGQKIAIGVVGALLLIALIALVVISLNRRRRGVGQRSPTTARDFRW